MSQKLFNKVVGILALLKAVSVGYYWITGATVVAFLCDVPGWLMLTVIIISLAYAYWAFTVKKNSQKFFDQIFGVLCIFGAIVFLYYLLFNVKLMIGSQIYPTWLLVITAVLDLYLLYYSFALAKNAK